MAVFSFLDRIRYYFFQVAPQLYSRGWVDPVPDPMLLRKSGSAANRTLQLWICSQELCSLDYRRGLHFLISADKTASLNIHTDELILSAGAKLTSWHMGSPIPNIKSQLHSVSRGQRLGSLALQRYEHDISLINIDCVSWNTCLIMQMETIAAITEWLAHIIVYKWRRRTNRSKHA
jgi:hypothetical protein